MCLRFQYITSSKTFKRKKKWKEEISCESIWRRRQQRRRLQLWLAHFQVRSICMFIVPTFPKRGYAIIKCAYHSQFSNSLLILGVMLVARGYYCIASIFSFSLSTDCLLPGFGPRFHGIYHRQYTKMCPFAWLKSSLHSHPKRWIFTRAHKTITHFSLSPFLQTAHISSRL